LRRSVIAVVAAAALASFSAAGATFGGGEGTADATADTLDVSSTPSPAASGSLLEGTGGGGAVNNEVVVLNVTDGRFANRAGSGIARVTGGDVTTTNSAAATSSCTDCRTVAVATQIVLIMGDSDYIAPTNQAVAINTNCLRCHSYALAYQYVITTDGIVHFTTAGQRRLAELEAAIRDLAASELPFLELEAQIDALVEQMWAVVDNELVQAGVDAKGSAAKDSDRADEDGSASAEAPSSPTPGPTPSDAAEPSPTASESSPTPTPTPTAGPTSSP